MKSISDLVKLIEGEEYFFTNNWFLDVDIFHDRINRSIWSICVLRFGVFSDIKSLEELQGVNAERLIDSSQQFFTEILCKNGIKHQIKVI